MATPVDVFFIDFGAIDCRPQGESVGYVKFWDDLPAAEVGSWKSTVRFPILLRWMPNMTDLDRRHVKGSNHENQVSA